MGCCGQKRAALRTRARPGAASAPASPPPPAPELPADPSVQIVEYVGDRAVLARGPGGRLYTFSPGRRAQGIPAPDAEQLLRNPLFRLDERRSNGSRQETA
jgi:hypothetical protein